VQGFVDAYNAFDQFGLSTNVTFSFAITGEYESILPVRVQFSGNMSVGPSVYFYRTADGANTWETEGNLATIFADPGGVAYHDMQKCVYLTNGQYLIRVLTGTGTAGTWTAELVTARVIGTYA
jgi:hypothetical protein